MYVFRSRVRTRGEAPGENASVLNFPKCFNLCIDIDIIITYEKKTITNYAHAHIYQAVR